MSLTEDHKEYMKAIEALNKKGSSIRDNVNHPSHYNQSGLECIDAMEAATINKVGLEAVCVAMVIKYLWRYEAKNGIEDAKKALWYLNKLIERMEENG